MIVITQIPNIKTTWYVYSSQQSAYPGVEVVQVNAIDTDPGPNGYVNYYFKVNGTVVSETPEFRINRITGVITAKIAFDAEKRRRYTVS